MLGISLFKFLAFCSLQDLDGDLRPSSKREAGSIPSKCRAEDERTAAAELILTFVIWDDDI